jgi:hypothetical protein
MRRSTFCATAGAAAAAAMPWPVRAARVADRLEARAVVPVVRVHLKGRELVMAIDTGDAVSTLSPQATAALGLTATPIPGTSVARLTLGGVEFAGTVLREHTAIVADVAHVREDAGFPVDGTLGYEAFKDRAITLDYAGGRVTFPEQLPDGESTPITWLKYHDRSPQLVTFDGLVVDGFPVTAQLDTMMSKNAILFTGKLTDLAIDPDLRAPPYTYEEAALRPGRVGSLRLGSTLLAAQPLVYAADATAHVPTTAIAAVVGDALFAKRAVTLDFPGSTLVVT